eukprot:m.307375 g.307375  ORF g.307375 m.307375 type:complete len:768 (+) comp42208_c0_seq1:80-2383(+)
METATLEIFLDTRVTVNPGVAVLPEVSDYLDDLTLSEGAGVRVIKIPSTREVTLSGKWKNIEVCRQKISQIVDKETDHVEAPAAKTASEPEEIERSKSDGKDDESPTFSTSIKVQVEVMKHLRETSGPELELFARDRNVVFEWNGKASSPAIISGTSEVDVARLKEKFLFLYTKAETETNQLMTKQGKRSDAMGSHAPPVEEPESAGSEDYGGDKLDEKPLTFKAEIKIRVRVMKHLRQTSGPELEEFGHDCKITFSWQGTASSPVVIRGKNKANVAKMKEKFLSFYHKAEIEIKQLADMRGNSGNPMIKQNGDAASPLSPRIFNNKESETKMSFTSPGGITLAIQRGDIITQNVDAIISPADRRLQHKNPLAKAIADAAGNEMAEECKFQVEICGDLDSGTAVATRAGRLACRHVIHAVGPNFLSGLRSSDDVDNFRFACINSLRYAIQLKLETVVMPSLSFGFPLDVSAAVMFNAFDQFSQRNPRCSVEKVCFMSDDDDAIDAWCQEMKHRYHGARESESPHFALPADRRQSSKFAETKPKSSGYLSDDSPQFQYLGDMKSDSFSDLSPVPVPFASNGDDTTDFKCYICLGPLTEPKVLPACKHTFCTICVEQAFQLNPNCPVCKTPHGIATGLQPDGTMTSQRNDRCLPGHDGCGTIVIEYRFPGGTQGPDHPNPGKPYGGNTRMAYLPDSAEGREVLQLLRKAFDAKHLFTIGRSVSTGIDNQITWNDVHHKTNEYGGPERFGYPDPTYLERVKEELAAKGIK